MLNRLQNSMQLNWRQVCDLFVTKRPLLDATEQTKLSWAKLIGSYAAVPDVFKDFFEPFQESGLDFPYTVLTPSYEGFLHPTTEKLICDFVHDIYILERKGSSYEVRDYPLEKINYVGIRTALLDAHIKICGMTKDGKAESSTVRFNAVTDTLFEPLLARMRQAGVEDQDAANSELEKFDIWSQVNYKFMMCARRSVLGGEKVLRAYLQPQIRLPRLILLGRTFYRTLSPTHAIILTDREIVSIREDSWYGVIWEYFSLYNIVTLSLSERDNNLFALCIQLPGNIQLEYLFEASAKRDLDGFLEIYRGLAIKSQ